MFRIYIKIAWRHLMNDKMYSFINVLGLSVSIAVSVFVLQYAQFELYYDSFFKEAPGIYRVTTDSYDNQQLVYRSSLTSLQVAPALKSDLPEVKEVSQLLCTSGWFICTLRYGDGAASKVFNEHHVFYNDGSFFNVFSWPLLSGDVTTALQRPFTVVIAQSAAYKYFGIEPALGKILHLKGSVDENDYTVTGVMPDLPEDSHLKVNVLFSASSLVNNRSAKYFETYTYVLLAPGVEPAALADQLPSLVAKVFDKRAADLKLSIQPVQEIHLDQRWQDEMKPSGNARSIYFLLIAAAFILVIALINYVNLATSRVLERAKEVGVRKVSGAHRSQLIRQFLTESFIIYGFSFLAAGVIVVTCAFQFYEIVGLPSFSVLHFPTLNETEWLIFAAFLVVIFFAAFYPARMISSFNPALVLKGRFTGSQKGLILRRGLVVFQFICAIGLMTGVYVMHDQHAFMQNQNLGFDIAGTLVVKAPANMVDESCYASIPRFRKKMEELSFVTSVTTSGAVPGQKIGWVGNLRKAPGEPVIGRNFSVQLTDPEFIKSYGLKLIAGKVFNEADYPKSRRFGTVTEHIMLNAEAVRQLRFASPEEAVDKVIYWDDNKCIIVGVVADYHQQSLKNAIQPMLFTANLGPNISVKLSPMVNKENLAHALALIRQNWNAFFPDSPFDYFFLDDFFKAQYSEDEQVMRLFDVFCLLAILVSCLGLFGLSLFTTRQRTKEIGIRKVLGATLLNLMTLLIREFLWPIVLACCIALPAAYFMVQSWLSGFAFHMELSRWQFVAPVLFVFIVALLTVSFQTVKAAGTNPTDTLKHE
jgi:putative ABC transport system permease protein